MPEYSETSGLRLISEAGDHFGSPGAIRLVGVPGQSFVAVKSSNGQVTINASCSLDRGSVMALLNFLSSVYQ